MSSAPSEKLEVPDSIRVGGKELSLKLRDVYRGKDILRRRFLVCKALKTSREVYGLYFGDGPGQWEWEEREKVFWFVEKAASVDTTTATSGDEGTTKFWLKMGHSTVEECFDEGRALSEIAENKASEAAKKTEKTIEDSMKLINSVLEENREKKIRLEKEARDRERQKVIEERERKLQEDAWEFELAEQAAARDERMEKEVRKSAQEARRNSLIKKDQREEWKEYGEYGSVEALMAYGRKLAEDKRKRKEAQAEAKEKKAEEELSSRVYESVDYAIAGGHWVQIDPSKPVRLHEQQQRLAFHMPPVSDSEEEEEDEDTWRG